MLRLDPRPLTPLLLCVPLALLAAITEVSAVIYEPYLMAPASYSSECAEAYLDASLPGLLRLFSWLLWAFTGLFAAGSMLGLIRRRWALALVRKCYTGFYVLAVVCIFVELRITAVYVDVAEQLTDMKFGAVGLFMLRWEKLWPLLPATALVALLHVISLRASVIRLYAPPGPEGPALGDRILEDIRTFGRSPRYRKSMFSSVTTHLLILVVLPWLWALRGCIEPYLVPFGSGTPAVARLQIVQRKPKKKRKRFLLRPDSKIIWEAPDLDDSDIHKQVDEETQLTHVADVAAVHGKMGAGGGTKGGWPEGAAGGVLRFIRIKHRGPDWDDGMDNTSRADQNFLNFIRKEVPFRVARTGEAHEIRLLGKYPAGRAPPFMYLTGDGEIYGVTGSEVKVLREYCLEGGMLFADAGSSRFDRAFRRFIAKVFPDKRLVVVADDDPMFQMPYVFPHGSPPLWHHGGRKAMGIKHRGRWCVFYHPGDLNDAWKTGHSGLQPALARASYQMGVNVIYYAITNYLEMTRKQRK